MTQLLVFVLLASGALSTQPAVPKSYSEGPCLAVHYGRPNKPREISMSEVLWNRLNTARHRIPGLRPRDDVQGYIAVRYADRWRIAENYRALVVFRLPSGKLSMPLWLQPIDYQQARHRTSSGCRVETSESLADKLGWSQFADGRGRTTAWILRWEH